MTMRSWRGITGATGRLNSPVCWVILCLALGCWLRFVGLTQGSSDFVLPEQARRGETTAFYYFHPDEQLVIGAALQPLDLLNPPFTVYGLLPVYLLRGVLKTAAFTLGREELAFSSPESIRQIYYIARTLAVLLSCATLWLVWTTGKRYFTPSAAGLGLTFVAFAPGAIQQAHFFIVDGMFLLLSVAAIYATLRAVEAGDRIWYIAAGVLIGATAAVRLNGLSLGLVLLAGHLLKEWTEGETRSWIRVGRSLTRPHLWMAGGAALGILLLVEPFLAVDLGRLWRTDSAADFRHALSITSGEVIMPWTLVDVHTTPYLDHWFKLFPPIAGWPLTWAFLVGWGYVLWRRQRPGLLMSLWCAIFFLMAGALSVKTVRYVMPLLPFLALFTGVLCAALWDRTWPLFGRWPGRGAVAGLILYTAVYGMAFGRLYQAEDSRIQAGRWIAENIPAGSSLGAELGGVSMRGHISNQRYERVWLDISALFYGTPYMLCSTQVDFLRERVADMDYLATVDVNRAAQFAAAPDLFPVVAGFYERLTAEQLGCKRIRRFKEYPEFLGMKFIDDAAEPSFLGYDHPAVTIFRCGKATSIDQDFDRWTQQLVENPHCADRQLVEIAAALQTGELHQARRLTQRLVDQHPLDKLAYLLQAEIHRRQENPELAAAALKGYRPESAQGLASFVRISPAQHHIPGRTALSLAVLGLPELALQVLDEGTYEARRYPAALATDMVSLYLKVAQYFRHQTQFTQMQKAIELSLAISPDVRAYNILAMLAYQKGESARAMEMWANSLAVDDGQAGIHAEMGKLVLQELEDYEQALYHLERAVEIDAGLGAELQQWTFTARRKAPEQRMKKEQ